MFKVAKTQHILAVNDFFSTVDYFTEKLGFTLDNTIGGWAFLHLDSFYLMVGDCQGEVTAKETNNHALFAYVNCEGIDALYRQYKDRGVKFNQMIADKSWGFKRIWNRNP